MVGTAHAITRSPAARRVAAGLALAACVAVPAGAQGLSPVLQLLEGAPTATSAPPQAVPQGSPIPGIRPPTPTELSPSLPAPAPVPPAPAANAAYAITGAEIDGVTVYDSDTTGPILQGLTGPAVPQSAIEAARVKLVNLYRADGYVYTVVNAVIDAGRLRLQVIEGHIVAVKLDGDIGPAGTQVLRFLDHLTTEGALNVRSLERWLLLASDVPGVTVRSVLNPSETEPGALTLVAQVTRKPYQGLLTADNRAFRQTGPEEILAVADFNSFSEFGERTEVSLYHTFNDTNTFGQAFTEFFIGGSGLKFRIYGGAGEATPSGDDLRGIGYDGVTRVFGGQFTYPVIRQRAQTLNLSLTLDALESDIYETGRTGPERASFDSLRVVRIGADYALLDFLLGPDRGAANSATFRISQGLPGFGATPNGNNQAARDKERIDFTKIGVQLSRVQTLFHPYEDATIALRGVLAGQFSDNVIPPAEKFYLGGPLINRGFYYGQVTGDRALATTIELQLNTPVPRPSFTPDWITTINAQVYAFYDWGQAWNVNDDPGAILRSAGGGVRLFVTDFTELDLEGVKRFTRRPLGDQQVSALPASAFYWQILARF